MLGSPLREYELLVSLGSEFEPEAESRVRSLFTPVEPEGVTVKHLDVLGIRKFAYEIKGRNDGVCVVVRFLANAGSIAEIGRQMRLTEDVIRTKLLRVGRK
uniref:Small ribosomal subunit protein bS6 n=1 Tax=Tropheryma whipplei (strain Twist) TaxID=203267 RepID=RS6_TROWT|nr:RecName: Full=Small ribosomal subunit protein bS6; AltName: Full=30S ribosomal protein S6 [Tropheryma whipplei str. Twist]